MRHHHMSHEEDARLYRPRVGKATGRVMMNDG